jgi:hypothetical protein
MMAPPALRNLKDCVMQSFRSGKVCGRIRGSRFCGDNVARCSCQSRSWQSSGGAASMRGGMREHDDESDDAECRNGQDVVEHQGRCRIAWIFHFFYAD